MTTIKKIVSPEEFVELAKGWLEESLDSIFTDPDLTPEQTVKAIYDTGEEFLDELAKNVPQYCPPTEAASELRSVLSKAFNSKKPKKKPLNSMAGGETPPDPSHASGEDAPENERKNMTKQLKPLADEFVSYLKANMIPEDKGDIFAAAERLRRTDPFVKRLQHAARSEVRLGELGDIAGPVRKQWTAGGNALSDELRKSVSEIRKANPRLSHDEAFHKALVANRGRINKALEK